MTSDRKIAANRRNSQQSTGPRSVQAKQRSRGNALRHGLRAVALRSPAISAEADRLATAISGKDADEAEREQALIIAESELILMQVRAARVDVIEQMVALTATPKPERDNQSCLEQLMRLDGYERRALSRRKRALRFLFLTIAK
jgi:hypothetical protein